MEGRFQIEIDNYNLKLQNAFTNCICHKLLLYFSLHIIAVYRDNPIITGVMT